MTHCPKCNSDNIQPHKNGFFCCDCNHSVVGLDTGKEDRDIIAHDVSVMRYTYHYLNQMIKMLGPGPVLQYIQSWDSADDAQIKYFIDQAMKEIEKLR